MIDGVACLLVAGNTANAGHRTPRSPERGSWTLFDGSIPALSIWHRGEAFHSSVLETGTIAVVSGRLFEADPDQLLNRLARNWPEFGALEQIDGHFALVVSDPTRRTFWAYTDRLGLVPLYYCARDDVIALASSPLDAALLAGQPPEPDPDFLAARLSLRPVATDRSPFRGVRTVPPGCIVELTGTSVRCHRVRAWDDQLQCIAPGEASKRLRRALERAVSRQCPPEERVAVMLSGGVDSPAILTGLSGAGDRARTAAATWTLSDYPEVCEGAPAARIAQALGAERITVEGSALLPGADIERYVAPDWPAANPFWPLIEQLYGRIAEAGIRRVFNGHGGDSLFAVHRYLLRDAWCCRQWGAVRRGTFAAILRSPLKAHLDMTIRGLGAHLLDRRPVPPLPGWLTPEARLRVEEMPLSHHEARSPDQKRACLDALVPGYWLEARFAERHGLVRDHPLQDHQLIELALGLPAHVLLDWQGRKRLMIDAISDRLPTHLVDGPRIGRLGPVLVDGVFVRHRDQLEEALFDSGALWPDFVDGTRLRSVIADPQRHRSSEQLLVWLCWCLEIWRHKIRSVTP